MIGLRIRKFELMYPFNILKFTIIYNQCGYNFLYSNSWFVVELTNLTLSRVLPRPAMSTTALVLNWKWLPLLQFLICSKTHALVLNLEMVGLWIRKFEWMYPFNILKFTIIYNQCGYNFLYSNSWFVVELTNCDLVQGFTKACNEYHSPSVELEMITSIPIPDL